MSTRETSANHEETSQHGAICTRCGCLCDDIQLTVRGEQIVAAERACPLGDEWFLSHNAAADESVCRIDGQPAELGAGMEQAATLLRAARSPLIYGLATLSCQAQRLVVALADRLGATIDTASSELPGPAGLSLQGVGEVTCTLGEVRNRGDLVIFWRANPVETHPRHLERYSLLPEGVLIPRGRADRICIVVDEQPTATSALADQFIRLLPARNFETLWTLRAIAQGQELDAQRVRGETGTELAIWQRLVARMKAARFGVLIFGEELAHAPGGYLNIDALFGLTRDLNSATRFVCQPLRSGQNIAGADQVLTWQTGFPFAVNFARGYPRSGTQWSASQMLARGQADALVLIGPDPAVPLPEPMTASIGRIPTIVISSEPIPASHRARISIRTAPYSISGSGAIHRLDDVAIPLRTAVPSVYPSGEAVLEHLLRQCRMMINAE